jgi:hypothetical protein
VTVDKHVGSLHEVNGRRWLGPPKTSSSARVVHLPPFLVEWDTAPAMTREEILATLADPHTWVWTEDGPNRSIMLMTTDHADTLFR